MRVLITGGAGFIGANLSRSLLADGYDVRVLDDLSTGRPENLDGLPVDLVAGSILDAALVASAIGDVDRVVHLAARASVPRSIAEPIATHEANATGTLRILEAARNRSVPVVVASSSSVYGDTEPTPKHEALPVAPRSPYAASKLATESYALAYQATYRLPVLALRFFNVYGPLQRADHPYAAVVPRFIEAALAGRPLEIHGDGRQTRDFTFVGTVVDVLNRAVRTAATASRPVDLAFGTSTDLLDIVARLEAALGRSLPTVHTAPRPGDIRNSTAVGSSLAAMFPDVVPVDLDDGLAASLAWFRSRVGAAPGG